MCLCSFSLYMPPTASCTHMLKAQTFVFIHGHVWQFLFHFVHFFSVLQFKAACLHLQLSYYNLDHLHYNTSHCHPPWSHISCLPTGRLKFPTLAQGLLQVYPLQWQTFLLCLESNTRYDKLELKATGNSLLLEGTFCPNIGAHWWVLFYTLIFL